MIRNIGALVVKGFQPREHFHAAHGQITLRTLGKDGTSHFGDLKVRHTVSPISMLGDLIPVMTGVAMAGVTSPENCHADRDRRRGSSTGRIPRGLVFAAQQRAPR